jgi:plastocyanin
MPRSAFRTALFAIPAALLLAAVGVACGGGDDTSKTANTTTAGTAPGQSAVTTVPAGAPLIDQENLTFKPSKLTVKVGEKVYFMNSESAIHTVNINGKNISGNMKKGSIVVWTFSQAGQYKITCDYHPQMNATITVE